MKNKIKNYLQLLLFISLTLTSCYYFFALKKREESYANASTETTNQEKIAYLTFDDGPSSNTEKILEILDKYNIKATFFVVGPQYTSKDNLLKKIVQSGHDLAIHSYEHNYNYIYYSKENYLKDFYNCLNWIKKVTGVTPKLYRFPGGSSNTIASKNLIQSIIKELNEKGFTHADWNVDTLDSYCKNEPNKIINNALNSIKKNENNNHYHQTVLMHDDIYKPATIKALPSIIEKIISKGYHFEPLKENSHIIKHVKEKA